ncbi:MAG: hypothetical protein Kow0092_27950 [Deferrisomatales bacterium]
MRLALTLALFAGLCLAGCATGQRTLRVDSPYRDPATLEKGQILHLATGRLLRREELFDYLAHYPVVYVGETHDNVDDHAVELAVLEALAERFPGRLALGMEMLRRPSQKDVDAYVAGETDEKAFVKVWQENWGARSFPYYRDILRFARKHRIPVLALNAGHDLRRAVREQGLEGLPPEMAARLPDMDLEDPYYRAFTRSMHEAHPHGSVDAETFHKIQALWDETMAQTAAAYLGGEPGRRLLVLAGGNHVRYGFGIPRRVFRRVPVPYAILSPVTVEYPEDKLDRLMDVDLPELPLPPADVFWAVGYEDLEDRQVMLGVHIEDVEEGGGVRVLGVIPESPAAQAGIRVGDVIVAADGEPVAQAFDLTYRVSLHGPGDQGSVEVVRQGERLRLAVVYQVVRHGR